MKRFIAIVLVVALALTFLMPAVGVSAESPQIEVEGTWTNTDPDNTNMVQKDTGNGFIRSGHTLNRNFIGGIEGTFFIFESVQVHNYGQDKEFGGGDDFRHYRFKGMAGEVTIADVECFNVEILWQVKCDKLVKDVDNTVEGIVTIHGETEDGGKVHGVLSIWKSGGISNYSGEVHFTP
ncbi:hypothetical protein ACFLVN_03980 [Chloroflexota bacterium]